MKRVAFEPGLLQILRLYILLAAVLLPFIWVLYSPMFSAEVALTRFIRPTLPVMVFLLIYTTFPWWQKTMGRAFLPLALFLLAAQAVFGNYVTLASFVPPGTRELAVIAFMLRLWITFQILILFVAWQYDLFWVLVSSITFCLLDTVLAFPFVNRAGPFYPLFVTIVAARLISITTVGFGLAWLIKRQREQRAALSNANRRLAQHAATTEQLAASQERNRLARELHDTLAHSLSGVTVQLEAVEALWDVNAPEARRMLDQALGSTRSGLTEARRALQSLRASPLEDLGLGLAITHLAESAAARANLTLDLDVASHLEDIPLEVEQCVYRVAQEALTNATRHAHAKSLQLTLARENGKLVLNVTDDGRGFNPSAPNGSHYGLKGLYERAEMIGATLQVQSRPQEGTTVRLEVPATEVEG